MFFRNVDEVDEYIGGMFREAGDHLEVGPKVRAAQQAGSAGRPAVPDLPVEGRQERRRGRRKMTVTMNTAVVDGVHRRRHPCSLNFRRTEW